MKYIFSSHQLLIPFISCVLISACNSKNTLSDEGSCNCRVDTTTSYAFCYQDIANFRDAYAVMERGGDTIKAFQTYFEKASPGMKGWISRYNWKPEILAKGVAMRPNYYKSLLNIDEKLKAYENEISGHYDKLRKLYPSEFVYIPPTYYFILWGGGGSIEMTGNMISMDYFGYTDSIDRSEFERHGGLFPEGKVPLVSVEAVPQIAVHEMVHLFQTYLQGELDYVSIYIDSTKSTMQAYAIREGGADFLAYLATGLTDVQRHSYGDANEEALWKLFKPLLSDHVDTHKGWFSGKSPDHDGWPWQIGYYVGFKIVENYYEKATDKEEAVMTILSAYEEDVFETMVNLYDQKF